MLAPRGPDGPVARVDLGEAVAARLREQILGGSLPPGARLVETALAASFGTSRGPIRDAISRLESSGLVTMNPRRGAYVTIFTPGDVEEIYSLRIALETLAAPLAAERGGAEEWEDMADALGTLTTAAEAGDHGGAAEADMRFHRAIVRAARHGRLAGAWEVFADQTLLLLQELSHLRSDVQAATGGHSDVLDALVAGDGPAATRSLRDHLLEAQRVVVERFEQLALPRNGDD